MNNDRSPVAHRLYADEDIQRLPFNPRWVAKCFAIVISVIVITGAIANYGVYNIAPHPDHPIADVLKRFDLGHEPSIPGFYSAAVMLATAAFLMFLGRYDRSGGRSRRLHWHVLSALFLLLAVDEAVMFHEMIDNALNQINFAKQVYFPWVFPGLAFAAVVGLSFLRFLLSLHRRTCKLLILSGLIFISGALGMESIAGLIFSAADNPEDAMRSITHVVVQAIEEGMEMVGVAMFLCALIDYANICGIEVAVGQHLETSKMAANDDESPRNNE